MNRIYYILIICFFFSCEEILLEEDISASKLQLLAPSDNAEIGSSQVVFAWNTLEGATSYEIQIATSDFQEPQQIISHVVEENQYSQELLEGNYEWRVKAINSGFETDYSFAKFRVIPNEEFSEQVLALISPPDGFISQNQRVELTWNSLEGAGLYRIQIFQGGRIIREETTSETAFQLDFTEGEAIWKVRAENEEQHTLNSERTIIVDTKAPNVPELVSPADGAVLEDTEVSFDWRREAVEGTEELDSLFIFGDKSLQKLVQKATVNFAYNTTLERDSTYFWFMKAYDEAGNKSVNSEVFSITIK